jgi:hypothetical protein
MRPQQPYGNFNNIYPASGAAAGGRGASPYSNGVSPSVLGRLQAAQAVAAAGVPSSRAAAAGGVPSSRGGVPPRTPPGGFVSPRQQMAAVMAQKQALGERLQSPAALTLVACMHTCSKPVVMLGVVR